MTLPVGLAQTFVAAREDGERARTDATALDLAIGRAADEGRRAWPGIEVADERLAIWLAERVPDGAAPEVALAEMPAADLYLACACAAGDPRALAAFEARVMPAVRPAVARIDSDAAFGRDVAEEVRIKLLVGEEGRPPRIQSYLGRGPLTAFVQVVAMRVAYSAKRARPIESAEDVDRLAAIPFGGEDAEVAHLRAQCAEPFRRAFRESLASLPPRERNVLRLHLLEGLATETIGRMYRVHRATVARWIASSHESLLKDTRKRLGRELHLPPGDLDSLMRAIQTGLEISIASALGLAEELR